MSGSFREIPSHVGIPLEKYPNETKKKILKAKILSKDAPRSVSASSPGRRANSRLHEN
jgi:hypothetical protein